MTVVAIAGCGDGASRAVTSIALDPDAPKLAAGLTLDVTASYVGTDLATTDASDVTWAVSDARVATVTPGTGGHAKLLGVATGTTTLSVTGQGVTDSFVVTVTPAVLKSIGITPPVPSLAAGTSQQLTATGTYSDMTTMDLSTMVAWSSSAITTATVDGTGLVQGVAAGHTTITATVATVSGSVDVTVTAARLTALQVTPPESSLPAGVTQQLAATGVFSDGSHQDLTTQVTWSSTAEPHATVSAGGLVTAVAPGTANIVATVGGLSSAGHVTVTQAVLRSIAIDPPAPKIALGLTQQLTATGTFSDGDTQDLTDQVTWAAASPAVATVASTGLATSLALGTTAVTATKGAIAGTTTLEVTAAVVQSIHVTPVAPSIAAGTTQQFVATATLGDTTNLDVTSQVTWASSDDHVAAISNDRQTSGLATGKAKGTATITATLAQASGNVTATAELTVGDATLVRLELSPVDSTAPKGFEVELTARGTFTDSSTRDLTAQVTWESSKPTIAEISNVPGSQGHAKTLALGDTTIRATFVQAAGNVVGTTQLTVARAELRRITVAPLASALPVGHQQAFTATGVFTDGERDVTTQVTWQSSDPDVASISNLDGTAGIATGAATGAVTISATFVQPSGNVSGTAALTVTDAVVESIAIAPVDATLTKGLRLQYRATATLSDTHTRDVTAEVTWASSNDEVAQVSNAAPRGEATGIAVGTATITATLVQPSGTVQDSATLTVIAPVLVSITVTPAAGQVAVAGTIQLTADGHLSDNTTQHGLAVAWRSRDTSVAVIDATTGVATGVALGSAPIVATSGPIHGDATLDVVPPPQVTSISPRDGQPDVGLGETIQVTFDQAMSPATFTTQTVAGPCSGALQLSQDDFASCLAFSAPLATLTDGGERATATPAFRLDASTQFKIRLSGSVTSAGGVALGRDVTQVFGWSTRTSFCVTPLVISQVYGGGGSDGAPLRDAFIELHNPSERPFDLTGFAVQHTSADGADWQAQALPSVRIPPGGYFLIQEASGANTSLPFPAADFVPAEPFVIDAAAGKVAITSVAEAMTDACPVGFTHVVDFVGFGGGLSCFEGPAGAHAPGNATAVMRSNNGCTDSNNNLADFLVGAPTPRGTAIRSSPHICPCL